MGFFHKKTDTPQPICGVVIAAAGSSQRMGGTDKLTALIGREPVLLRAIQPFQNCPLVGQIVIVTRSDRIAELGTLCRDRGLSKVTDITAGGDTRTESVLNGVRLLKRRYPLAAIHDGARPLVTSQIIEETILRAKDCSAAAPAIPVTDTIKVCDGDLVTDTPDRATLYAVQTPQVFDRDLIEGALQKALSQGLTITDDCQAVECLGMHVHMTRGSARNLKITTPTDLILANCLYQEGSL